MVSITQFGTLVKGKSMQYHYNSVQSYTKDTCQETGTIGRKSQDLQKPAGNLP